MAEVQAVEYKWPNEVTSANAGEHLGFAVKSRAGLSGRPGVAEFCRWAK
jgi:hypothetical protein